MRTVPVARATDRIDGRAPTEGLRLGITLTADQVAHLTNDIVCMEIETVSQPDGTIV